MEILGYIGLFLIGLILGLLGGGGSILSIPILVYLFSLQIVDATAYSLIIVGVTSLFGAFQRFRNSMVYSIIVFALYVVFSTQVFSNQSVESEEQSPIHP